MQCCSCNSQSISDSTKFIVKSCTCHSYNVYQLFFHIPSVWISASIDKGEPSLCTLLPCDIHSNYVCGTESNLMSSLHKHLSQSQHGYDVTHGGWCHQQYSRALIAVINRHGQGRNKSNNDVEENSGHPSCCDRQLQVYSLKVV